MRWSNPPSSTLYALEKGRQIAFARVITDRSVFAYLADVFVVPDHRGRGVSKLLLDAILADPEVKEVRLFRLATKDAHGLYAMYGFASMAQSGKKDGVVRRRPRVAA